MPRLAESTVQRVALEHLQQYYNRRAWMRKIFAQIEMRTKKEYGSKRADGLIAFRHWLWGTYVISMEAKSYNTLTAMKPYRDDWLFLRNCLWAGLLICILSGAFFWSYRINDGFWQFLLPFNAFLGGAILYGMATFRHFTHKKVDVIRQLQQYPANEQWLAFSQDSLNALAYDKVKKLKKMARSQSIGIIVVQPKGKVKILLKPRMQWGWGKDYLRFYSRETDIRKIIGASDE